MIFLLDIILLINLITAFYSFKNILAPPVLMGAGMLLASMVSTSYYEEFEMEYMQLESVLILGLGTLFFTICCILQKKQVNLIKLANNDCLNLGKYKINNLTTLYVFLDIIAIACFFLKMYSFMSFFGGNLSGSELIGEAKFDSSSGNLKFHFPTYIVLMAFIGRTMSFFTCWFLSISILSKDKHKFFRWLLFVHLFAIILDGITGGTKDVIFDPIFRFAVTFVFIYFVKRHSISINRKIVLSMIISFVFLFLGFKGLSALIGRAGVEDRETSDMFAEYLGAEIKNFDIYIQGYDGNPKNKYWGEATFHKFYQEIIPGYESVPGAFQDIGNYHLGNVYTQWFSFHKDFGELGVILMTIIIAFISMFIFNNAQRILYHPMRPNLFLFIYSSISMCIFMSFFSSRFTENVFTIIFIRRAIVLLILIFIFEHSSLFRNKRNKHLLKKINANG